MPSNMDFDLRILGSSEIDRAFEIDRTEHIESEYVPVLGDDGLTIRTEMRRYDPPRMFANWDEDQRNRRRRWWRSQLDTGGAAQQPRSDRAPLGMRWRPWQHG